MCCTAYTLIMSISIIYVLLSQTHAKNVFISNQFQHSGLLRSYPPFSNQLQNRWWWTWRHRQFWIPVQFNGKPNFNLKHHLNSHEQCKIIYVFQILWGGISHLKPVRRYLRYFRGTHWQSSLSRRLLAFYTGINRVTECLYGAQCRSRDIGEWLKGLFCGHGRGGHVHHRLLQN